MVCVFPLSSVSNKLKESEDPTGIRAYRLSARLIAPTSSVGSFVIAVLSLVITNV